MSNIKGITIEIEGKTTGLERALKDINKESAKTSITPIIVANTSNQNRLFVIQCLNFSIFVSSLIK